MNNANDPKWGLIQKAAVHLVLILGALIMVGPFVFTLSSSLQGPGMFQKLPPELFKPPLLFSNYVQVWRDIDFFRYTMNSLLITCLCVFGGAISAAFGGFGLARYRFKGVNAIFFAALATMMIPANMLVIPQYIMWQKVGLLDTYVPIIVPYFFGTAFGLFLMRQCFKSISNELYEAAFIDGCSPVAIFAKIYLPLGKASLAALAVFTFMNEWNDMYKPLIYITTKSKYTLTLGLLYMRGGEYQFSQQLLMAAAVIMMIPVVIVYLCAQKYFVQGIVTSGIKG